MCSTHLPNSHAPAHAGQTMNQNVAVLPETSAMNEVVAHRKVLCEILKKHAQVVCLFVDVWLFKSTIYLIRIIGGHHTQVVLVGEEVFGIIMDRHNVCYAVHRELINVLRISVIADIQAR